MLVLACLPRRVRRLLNVTGLDSASRVYETVTDAENALVAEGRA